MSTQPDKRTRKHSERGVALVASLLVLLLVTAIAAGMIIASSTETNISANFRDEQTAFFAAKGGIEEIRDRLRSNATNSLIANLPANVIAPANTNSVLYVTNPKGGETDTPWNTTGTNYPDDQICASTDLAVSCAGNVPGPTGWYTSASASATYAATPVLPWKWARITLKTDRMSSGTATVNSVDGSATSANRVCWNGANEVSLPAGNTSCAQIGDKEVYVITVLAVTTNGSRRMVQAEATTTAFPTLPAPLVFDGSNPIFGAPNSNAFNVNGADVPQGPNAGVGCGGANANSPAVGGFDTASVNTLVTDIPRPAKYTGAGGSPSVTNVSGQMGTLNTVQGLRALVTSIESAATPANTYTGASTSSITNPGTNAAPVINVVKGDLSTGGGFTGSGILLVEGTLTMSGNPNFNGLILVIGKGVFNKNGGGNGTTDGAILVANLNDSSGNPIASGAPGAPTINWNGGGNATIQYDSCWSTAMSQSFPYKVVAVREMMY